MTWYTGTCSITIMGLLYRLDDMVKCVCYMSLGSNGFFMTGTALTSNHYRTNIFSNVGQPRLNSIVLLVLCTVVYNIRGTGVVLQVPWDRANPAEKE
jgi:hypothetical protein